MERKLVFVFVLIFGLTDVFGFYISQVNNQSTVYEVKEDETTHTLTITNPQPEKPILREITYYHIIEKPYEQVNSIKHNNITNKGNIIDITHNILSNADNILNENNNITSKNKNSSKHTTDNEQIMLISDHSMIDIDDTIKGNYIAENADNLFDSNNINNNREIINNGNRITDTDNITNDKKKSDDREHFTTNYKNTNNEMESEKVDSIIIIKSTVEDKDMAETFESLDNTTDIINQKYITYTEINSTDTEKVILNKLITDNPDNIVPSLSTIFNHNNATNIENKTGSNNATENKKVAESAIITNLYYANDNSNINVTGILINTDIYVDNMTKPEDIFENTDNLTKGEITIDIEHVSGNTDHLLDTNTINSEEKTENINNNDRMNTTNTQANKDDIPTNKINKIISVDPGNTTYSNDIILDNSITSNKDAIAMNNDYDDKNMIINETNTLKKEVVIENEIFSQNAENFTDSDYYDINRKNMTINNEDAFIKIVDDGVSLIEDHNNVIIDSDNNNGDNDNKIIDGDSKNINNDNNMVDYGKLLNELLIYVDNDDDNPYDGKEGVIFDDRHFTNGHGFQYYHPDPENQNISGDPLSVEEETINPNLKEASNDTEIIEKLEDEPFEGQEIGTVLDENQEHLDSLDMIKRRRKRATLIPVNEDYAPEDLLKDVMYKVSEKVKRSIEEEGTYGMRLTGNKGVVWNDFDDQNVLFPVGTNVEDRNYSNEYAISATTTDKKENNEIDKNYFETEIKQELSTENTGIEGSSPKEYSKEEYTNELHNEITELNNVEHNLPDKTYGMSLTGGHGSIWNDLGNNRISYNVGEPQNKLINKRNKDDEIINSKIEAFHNFLNYAPMTDNSKFEEPNLTRTSTENPINRAPSTDKLITNKPSTKKPVTKEPSTKNPVAKKTNTIKPIAEKTSSKKPFANEPSTEKPKAVQPTITTEAPNVEKPIIVEPKIEKPISDLDKTYGMSLAEDQGIVWNDLNERRVSYYVGAKNEPTSKTNNDNEVINKKIKQFQNSLIESPSRDEAKIEIPSTYPNIEEPTTKKPKIEPLTEEPIIYEPATEAPKTNRPIVVGPISEEPKKKEPTTETPSTETQDDPVKTFGMSLTGDNGIVWNDLHGDRLSYHVGNSDTDIEEEMPLETTTNPDLQDTPKPIIIDNDKDKVEDDLLNEIDAALTEVDNILAEFVDETEKSKNITHKAFAEKIINIVKEVFDNETAKLKGKVKGWVKEEVATQIEEYFATHGESKPLNNSGNYDNETDIVGKNEEQLEEDTSKKRKDCEEKKEMKGSPIKIAANNIYGNSVGNANVTNIFIFNFNNKSDIDEIGPANNGTDGIFVFGNNNEKPVELEIQEEEREIEDTATEKITTNSEIVESFVVQSSDGSKETTGTNPNPPEKEDSNEKDNVGDHDEHESGGQSTIDKPNESASAILEENEIKDKTTEKVTSPDQNIISDQTTEFSKEYTETITEANEIIDNSGNEATETSKESTNEILVENGIKDTSVEKNTSEPDLVEEELNNISIDLNGIPKREPNDISEEQNVIPDKESNDTVKKDSNDISEEINGIPEDEPKYNSEELDDITEKEPNDTELNDISEELNGIPEDETREPEDNEIEIDVRTGLRR